MRNYRQAKRNREETKKKKHQEKLQRKLSRGATPEEPGQEVSTSDTQTDPKVSP
jgi:hypothetical protein